MTAQELNPSLRELACLRVIIELLSLLNSDHVALARSAGISDDEMAAMADAEASQLLDETDELIIRYAELLTRTRRVNGGLYRQLESRLTRGDLVE
jgi:hypothetical protein